ncbi:MAG: DMT family transporter [Anaerolineae bacterium]|jgi:drug/metabolite transporter (DMT)-like permease|nr:DMT family transporter [Anaerolineae bacterium]MBT7072801.1 DMT family transporter [Anaerolineae bacterium]MBT7323804.1 DMT family transporter [Anaerolineae bacterium]
MQKIQGALLIIISSIAFGTMAVLAPLAYKAGATPITLLFLRFLIAGIIMVGWMLVARIPFPRGKTLLGLILIGGIWYVAQTLAYFTALSMTAAGLVGLLLYLYPAVVALIGAIAFKEHLTKPKLAALGLALLGTAFTLKPNGDGFSLGVLLALTAAVLYAGYIVVGKILMEDVDPRSATAIIMLSTGVSFGGIVALRGFQPPSEISGWVAIAATVLCSIIALGTFFTGLEKVGSTNAAILSTIEPFVTVGLAAWWLGERLDQIQLLGGVLILLAVVFLTQQELKKT